MRNTVSISCTSCISATARGQKSLPSNGSYEPDFMPSICGLMMQHSEELAPTNFTTYAEWAPGNSHRTQSSSLQQTLNISFFGLQL
jgi:hypothetical protein